jgi:RNA polymerase sigma factor (sigma-70 family)
MPSRLELMPPPLVVVVDCGKAAQELLIRIHIQCVAAAVRKYSLGEPYDSELYAQGMYALEVAVTKFTDIYNGGIPAYISRAVRNMRNSFVRSAEFTQRVQEEIVASSLEDKRGDSRYAEGDMPESQFYKVCIKEEITLLLECLSDHHRQIITMYYGLDGGEPMTIETIALHFDTTEGAIKAKLHRIKGRLLERVQRYEFSLLRDRS